MISPADVEAIERATAAAVAPGATVEVEGWLVTLAGGAIRRAGSATPLRHDLPPDPAAMDAVEALYAEHGLPAEYRIAEVPGLAGVRAALTARGFAPYLTTLTMIGSVEALGGVCSGPACEMLERPDAAWSAVFTGEGFDPVEGAGRAQALGRSPDAAYGAVRDGGRTIAVGVAAFGHGWMSIHGMRTETSRRGEGLAGRVLAGLAAVARARGYERVFLQVDEVNAPAIRLYERAGFELAWRYKYWARAGG